MTQQLSHKPFYVELIGGRSVPDPIVKDCFAVFACRHKFCREVCPVYQEDRDESHTSYGFHATLLAISKGMGELGDVREQVTYCLECGACELRCPNTLFAGDFYGASTTTVDLVRKVRRDLVAAEIGFEKYEAIVEVIDRYLQYYEGPEEDLTRWAEGLDLPFSGETMLFVDYFNAFETTVVARNAAKIMTAAGVEFGILRRPGATLGELLDVNLEVFVEHARHNVGELSAAGAKRVVLINPHDYTYFTRDYVAYLGELPFEVVYITDFIAELLDNGKIEFNGDNPLSGGKVSYHDPCTLSKICGITESPRRIIRSLPGVEFIDVSPVAQWSYCCGKGSSSFKTLHPDTSYRIGTKRLQSAADVGAERLVVACPHCEDQLTDVQARSGAAVAPVHVLALVAQAMGLS
jgi:heterodisulfide reductase subunit D